MQVRTKTREVCYYAKRGREVIVIMRVRDRKVTQDLHKSNTVLFLYMI